MKIFLVLICLLLSNINFGQSVTAFSDKKTGFIGFKNAKGEVIIEATKYTEWDGFSEGMILVGKKDKWGFINISGEEIIPLTFKSAHIFSQGLAGVRENKKWGYIDKTGKMVIEPAFDFCWHFKEDLVC